MIGISLLEHHLFDNYSYEGDFSTPDHHSLATELPEDVRQVLPQSSDNEVSSIFSYKLLSFGYYTLRKGRVTKLTEDTIEDVNIAPSAHWNETLKSELATLVKENVPELQYQPDETTTTVSNSKRGVPPYTRRFPKLIIEWSDVENKLRSWSSLDDSLKVVISFIYKENQSTSKKGKAGRGATKKYHAALDSLITQQEASGSRAVWENLYQLIECMSAACKNRGFSCWRYKDKHHKLDSDIMDRLVDRAEQGYRMDIHNDVPDDIRELIYTREDEEEARKKRKRKSSDQLPVNIRVFCHGHRDDSSADYGESQKDLHFPLSDDEAPIVYSDWLRAKVANEDWQMATSLAAKITVDKGYDLRWLYANQEAGKDMLIKSGVLEGVPARFVSWVRKWTDDVYTE
jgi:hypothetical protein